MNSIADFLVNHVSGATAVVDLLVGKGFVTRMGDPNDRRLVLCELLPAGHQYIAETWQIGRDRLHRVASFMDDLQLKTVVAGFEALARR